MVTISNEQRDQAVRYLQRLCQMVKDDGDLRTVNLVRLARRLAKQLEKKKKQ